MAELKIDSSRIEIWQYSGLSDTEAVILNGINYIGKHAFSDSLGLRKLVINGNDTFLDEGCFSYCLKLNAVFLNGVNILGKASFAWCIGINKIFLDVEHIGEGCFFHCSNLEQVVFSKRVTTIGERSFAACQRLKKISFLGDIPKIGKDCFFHTQIFEYE